MIKIIIIIGFVSIALPLLYIVFITRDNLTKIGLWLIKRNSTILNLTIKGKQTEYVVSPETNDLKTQLRRALASEDYIEAAKVRDLINKDIFNGYSKK